MKFNLYIHHAFDKYNIMEISLEQLEKVVSAYTNGNSSFTLSGKKYTLGELQEIRIYTEDKEFKEQDLSLHVMKVKKPASSGYCHGPKGLALYGTDVTDKYIGDVGFGDSKKVEEKSVEEGNLFVNPKRIDELKSIKSQVFDLTRLIKFCEELNDNYSRGNFLSVAMIGRSLINHIPPIFGHKTFNEVENNYNGGTSFKKNTEHLNKTLRNIADSFLHETIRKSETLPNSTQVNFAQDLDVLLAEVYRVLK